MYLIASEGRNNITLFLIDRKQDKSKWWTSSLHNAMIFMNESVARKQCSKLRYNNPDVITLSEAERCEQENHHYEAINDVHPFSEEAFSG